MLNKKIKIYINSYNFSAALSDTNMYMYSYSIIFKRELMYTKFYLPDTRQILKIDRQVDTWIDKKNLA